MHATTVLSLLVFTLALPVQVFAWDDDVPQQCLSVCSSLSRAEDQCDDAFDDDDQALQYRQCICNASGAREAIPLCEACYYQEDRVSDPNGTEEEWRDNDANSLLRQCALSTLSTYNLASASPTQTVVAALTTSGGSTIVPPSATGSSTGGMSTTSPTVTPTGGNTPSSTSTSTTPTTSNAAPTKGAGDVSFMAGAGLLIAAAFL